MANKKIAPRSGNRKQASSSRITKIGILSLFIAAGLFLLYQHYLLTRRIPTDGLEMPQQKEAAKKTSPNEETIISFRTIKNLELPAPSNNPNEKIVDYYAYTVSYNSAKHIPSWVAYELTAEETKGRIKRKSNFSVDPDLRSISATNTDYTNSGYDRGHLAPAADMAFSERAMEESFFFTNIAPQNQSLNRGSWKKLEEAVRKWTKKEKALYIVTGTVTSNNSSHIGKSKVAVPDYFYKAVLSTSHNRPKAIGFVFRNQSTTDSPLNYAVSIDSIESLTRLDLYPALPDEVEEIIEGEFNKEEWN